MGQTAGLRLKITNRDHAMVTNRDETSSTTRAAPGPRPWKGLTYNVAISAI